MDVSSKRQRPESKVYALNRSYTTKRQKTSSGEFSGSSKSKSSEPLATICDSGAYSIKVGNSNLREPMIMPNCIMKAKSERKRLFVANQIEDCRDLSGLYYLLPCEKGYITKWDVQKPVWDYVFQNHPLNDKPLIMTQPIFNFKSIQECIDEIFYEEYEVKSMLRACPTDLARYQYVYEKGKDVSCIIIDSGYSFTHIIPYIKGKKYYPGIKRIFVGGKLLTNYLKDILSYRKLHVMEETYVINQVKEDTCFVSQSLKDDMKIAKNTNDNSISRTYILPDFNNIRRGYVQDPSNKEIPENCQILHLNNERFTVPELLMRPSNIGMQSMGIPEAVAKCVEMCPVEERQALMDNIVLIGGNSCFPGYKDRLYMDIRSLTPCHLSLHIYRPDNPIFYAWEGGRTLSRSKGFQSMLVSKYDYDEYGSRVTYKKFSDWITAQIPQPKIEIKPKKISILENLRGLDIFGKGGEEPEERTVEPIVHKRPPIELVDHRPPTITKQEVTKQEVVNLVKEVKTVEIKKNFIPITTIRLPQHTSALKLPQHTSALKLPQHTPALTFPQHTPALTFPQHTPALKLPQHTPALKLPQHTSPLKPNVLSTLRFIPIGEVLNGNTIISNVKLG